MFLLLPVEKLLGCHLTLSICSSILRPLMILNLNYTNEKCLKLLKNFQAIYFTYVNKY